jgi:hypothetical protein
MKALFYGISVATLAGLAIGGLLRPVEIAFDARTGGPQIALADSGRRAYGDAEYQAATNAYPHGLPDYVVGTDNLRPVSYSQYGPEPGYEAYTAQPIASDLPVIEPASYSREVGPMPTYDAATQVRYPSQGGGILAGLEPGEPEDLGPEVFEPADAPPAQMAAFQADQALPDQ